MSKRVGEAKQPVYRVGKLKPHRSPILTHAISICEALLTDPFVLKLMLESRLGISLIS